MEPKTSTTLAGKLRLFYSGDDSDRALSLQNTCFDPQTGEIMDGSTREQKAHWHISILSIHPDASESLNPRTEFWRTTGLRDYALAKIQSWGPMRGAAYLELSTSMILRLSRSM